MPGRRNGPARYSAGSRPGELTKAASSSACTEPAVKFLNQPVQIENTAPPGLTVIVGDCRPPQGTK